MRFALSAVAAISGVLLLGLTFYGQPAVYLHQAREQWHALLDMPDPEDQPDQEEAAHRMALLQQQVARLQGELATRQSAPPPQPEPRAAVTPEAAPPRAQHVEPQQIAPKAAPPPAPQVVAAVALPEPPPAPAAAPPAAPMVAPVAVPVAVPPAVPVAVPGAVDIPKPMPLQMDLPKAEPPKPDIARFEPPATEPAQPEQAAVPPKPPASTDLASGDKAETGKAMPKPEGDRGAAIGPALARTEIVKAESPRPLAVKPEAAKPPPAPPPPQKVALAKAVPAPPPLPKEPPARDDTDDTQSVLARLRQMVPGQPAPRPAAAPVRSAEAPAEASRPRSAPSVPSLSAARGALANGRIEDARRLLQQAQLQLVFRPINPSGEDSPAAAQASADVAHALDALSANDAALSRRYIDVATADLSGSETNPPIQESRVRASGYAPAYPPR